MEYCFLKNLLRRDLLFVEYVIEIVVVVVVVSVVEVVEIVKPNAGSVVEVLCKLLHFLKKVIRSGQVSSVSGFLTCKIQEKTFFKSY